MFCCLRLQNLGAITHFFLYYFLCTSHSTVGFMLKLRHSISDGDITKMIITFTNPTAPVGDPRGGEVWPTNGSPKWGMREPQGGWLSSPTALAELGPAHTSGWEKNSTCCPYYCYRATSACFPEHWKDSLVEDLSSAFGGTKYTVSRGSPSSTDALAPLKDSNRPAMQHILPVSIQPICLVFFFFIIPPDNLLGMEGRQTRLWFPRALALKISILFTTSISWRVTDGRQELHIAVGSSAVS